MFKVSICASHFVRRWSCDEYVRSQTVILMTRGLSACKYPLKAGHTITPSQTVLMHVSLGTTMGQVWRTPSNAVRLLLHLDELPFSNQTSSLKGVAIEF